MSREGQNYFCHDRVAQTSSKGIFHYHKIKFRLRVSNEIFFFHFCPFTCLQSGEGKLRFISSRWGGKLLVVNNYLFSSNKRDKNGTTYWRCTFCSQRKKDPCKVRCRTRNGEVANVTSVHNHAAQLSKPSVTAIDKKAL